MLIHTIPWGQIDDSQINRVKCPTCGHQMNGRLSDDGKRIEIPVHGKTKEMECRSHGWFKITQDEPLSIKNPI